jgi:selenocysteine-specific elongation factor
MTIDLGFAWTDLPSGATVAFVDVPGHERFVPNMLAGVGAVPAAVFVVAADEGWMPQSAEHLAALDALGVRHGLLAVTRSDLADPAAATARAVAEISRTSLGEVEAIAVSPPAGTGLPALRAALDRLLARLPTPDLEAPVRLWIDRRFTVRGSGTVVTGTLAAGRLAAGDELELAPGSRTVRVRALQTLARPVGEASAVARVAVNLRGAEPDALRRGAALLTPRRFHMTSILDVRVHGDPVAGLPRSVVLHVGSAAVAARVRPLGADTARLTLGRELPLRIGDRGLLRDPGQHHIAGGATVLDVAPPALNRRGAAAERARLIARMDGQPDVRSELSRRGVIRRTDLERMGVTPTSAPITPITGDWLIDPDLRQAMQARLGPLVADWTRDHPLEPGPPVEAIRRALRLPDRSLVHALLSPPFTVRDGRVVRRDDRPGGLPSSIAEAIEKLRTDLDADPFAAPDAARLAELRLGPRELAAAERAGALVRIAEGVVLLPGSVERSVSVLATLTQPFTVSEAKQALGTTRRVAVPLMEFLDRRRLTERLPDDRRRVRRPE